jgi:hypothetical protein
MDVCVCVRVSLSLFVYTVFDLHKGSITETFT